MSKLNDEFLRLIEHIEKSTGLGIGEISIKSGRNEGYISQMKSRISKKKDFQVAKSYIDLLRLKFADDLAKSNHPQLNGKNVTLEELLEVNSKNAQANLERSISERINAEARNKEAENFKELVALVKAHSNALLQTNEAFDAKLDRLLGAMAEIGSGKRWHSKQEAAANLHRMVHEQG